jgi:integrative and conjugative element protein (TIGR02256 family)
VGAKYSLNNISLIIEDEVLNKLYSYRQESKTLSESGGLLLGRTDIHGNTRLIEITEPLAKDIRRRFFFKRLDNKHLKIKKEANKRCLYFKGNWHTHPENFPNPSFCDKSSWEKSIKNTKTGESLYIYFIIVGNKQIRVWAGNMESKKIEMMNFCNKK